MRIVTGALTTSRIVGEGERISLGLRDEAGRVVDLQLSIADAGSIAMTLPLLLRQALRRKFCDDTLRYVYPLEGWQIEAASDGDQVILTLQTGDGFEASFAVPPEACRSLGRSLDDGNAGPMPFPMAN